MTAESKQDGNLEAKLQAVFPFKDLEFRPARLYQDGGKTYAQMLCYISSRAVMQRLDDVFGCGGWMAKFYNVDGGISCELTVKVDGCWVSKYDAAEANPEFPVKGPRSDSLKRAAVHLGIGRYLYELGHSDSELYPTRLGLPNEVWVSGRAGKDGPWVKGWVAVEVPGWALTAEDENLLKGAASKMATKILKAESAIIPAKPVQEGMAQVLAQTVAAVSSPTDSWPFRYKPDFETGQAIRPKIKELQAQKLAIYDKNTKPWSILTKIAIPEWSSFASNVAAVTQGKGVGKVGAVTPPKPAPVPDFEAYPDQSVDLTASDDDIPWDQPV